MKFRVFEKPVFSLLLSILLPGLGHIFWGEYLFGLFVMLIMSMGLALFYVSFVLVMSALLWAFLLGLPLLFYLFSLVDLRRVILKQRATAAKSISKAIGLVVLAVLLQLLVPASPARLVIDNCPSVFKAGDNDFSPAIRSGDLCLVNPTAYAVSLFYFDRSIYHTMPARFDIIRYNTVDGIPRTGLIVGLPEEQIEIVNGLVVADGRPIMEEPDGLVLQGDSSLTTCGPYSILVAELYLGRVKDLRLVSLFDVDGKVSPVI